jgi:hypothetical protein
MSTSMYQGLMTFVNGLTITMLAGATNAPVRTTTTVGGVTTTKDPQNVLPAYHPKAPAGIRDPSSDYVFYLVQFTDSPINRQIDVIHSSGTDTSLIDRTIKYVRNLRISWQCYGDDAFEWADTLRIMLFDPTIKELFAAQGISLITDVSEPVFIPEPINGQWFHRYDISAEFNQLVTRTTTVSAVASADVIIETEKGVEAECSVSTVS